MGFWCRASDWEVKMRAGKVVAGVAVVGGLLIGGTSALGAGAASTPKGGSVHVLVEPTGSGTGGKILFTGAIGDLGTTVNIDQNGKPDPNGNYGKVTLSKGTLEVNITALKAKANSASPAFNKATCSATISVTAPITLLDGTGLYAGISGTLHASEQAGFIGPRNTSGKNKGQCNLSNSAQPVGLLILVHGTGKVQFG
jgi:hypothetical protein